MSLPFNTAQPSPDICAQENGLMSYAPTLEVSSHREIKAFEERVRYWERRGLSLFEATKKASQPNRRTKRHLQSIKGLPANLEPGLGDTANLQPANLDPGLSDTANLQPANLEPANLQPENLQPANPKISLRPTQEEILREVQRQKALGAMTEIAPELISSAAQSGHYPSVAKIPDQAALRRNDKVEPKKTKEAWPYWLIAGAASTWLVHSSAQAFGGGFWNYVIFAAFDYSPMLLLGARVDVDTQVVARRGAIAVFLIGLALYLAPSIQTLINEYSAYTQAEVQYAVDQESYISQIKNTVSLRDQAKSKADESEAALKSSREKFGQNSWRTQTAQKESDLAFREWKRLSEEANSTKAPITPKINDELRTAAQTIGMRVGLFAIVFLLMFVMRKLEGERNK